MYHPYAIRVYQPSDLPRLQEITAVTFGPVSIDRNMEQKLGSFGQGNWSSRKLAAIADDCLAQPDGVFVAVERGGVVAGYVTTRLNPASGVGWIPNLAVDPEHQGQGWGRVMLDALALWARGQKAQWLWLEVRTGNVRAQQVYLRYGYRKVGERKHYYPAEHGREDAIVMSYKL